MGFSISDLRLFAFIAAVVLYGLFGSPTPDDPGIVEALIGGLLLVAAGLGGFYYVLKPQESGMCWQNAARMVLVYGLCAGCVGAFVQGQDMERIFRDVIPFFFMLLPLFLWPFIEGQGQRAWWVLVTIGTAGVLFALRAAADYLPLSLPFERDALYYLGNAPTVLLAACLCFGVALDRLMTGVHLRNIAVAGVLIVVGVLCVLPLVAGVQRASLGYLAFYICLVCGLAFLKTPKRALFFFVIFVIAGWVFFDVFFEVFNAIRYKTDLVGITNMRAAEWAAVWGEITVSPFSFLFGQGWGATFSSPAVADIRVGYTHSLLSSMMLKTGILGVIFTSFYLFLLARCGFQLFGVKPLIAAAIAGPVIIDVFLYAAYKSLDFGLVLALIPLCMLLYGRVASGTPIVYSKREPKSFISPS